MHWRINIRFIISLGSTVSLWRRLLLDVRSLAERQRHWRVGHIVSWCSPACISLMCHCIVTYIHQWNHPEFTLWSLLIVKLNVIGAQQSFQEWKRVCKWNLYSALFSAKLWQGLIQPVSHCLQRLKWSSLFPKLQLSNDKWFQYKGLLSFFLLQGRKASARLIDSNSAEAQWTLSLGPPKSARPSSKMARGFN